MMLYCYQYNKDFQLTSCVVTDEPPFAENQLVFLPDEVVSKEMLPDGTYVEVELNLFGLVFDSNKIKLVNPVIGKEFMLNGVGLDEVVARSRLLYRELREKEKNTKILSELAERRAEDTFNRQERINAYARLNNF